MARFVGTILCVLGTSAALVGALLIQSLPRILAARGSGSDAGLLPYFWIASAAILCFCWFWSGLTIIRGIPRPRTWVQMAATAVGITGVALLASGVAHRADLIMGIYLCGLGAVSALLALKWTPTF